MDRIVTGLFQLIRNSFKKGWKISTQFISTNVDMTNSGNAYKAYIFLFRAFTAGKDDTILDRLSFF